MNDRLSIPPKTAAEIANPAAPGERHTQARRIAISLIGDRFSPDAVFAQLRSMYDADVTDRELNGVVSFALGKYPMPSGYGPRSTFKPARIRAPIKRAEITAEIAIANCERWLDGFRCDECDLWHVSPWRPLEDWRLDSLMILAAAYDEREYINIVTDYSTPKKDSALKANPSGAGSTMLRNDWMREIRDNGTPQSEAGAWVRMNPVTAAGSGSNGAIRDADVTSLRFALLESDKLPHDLALSLFARLALPVFAILSSGGRGPHAWVKLDCTDEASYRADVAHIFDRLRPLGIDDANSNPSRLSRLVGAKRIIGANGAGEQRLYYLEDAPHPKAIFPKRAT